MIYDYVVTLKNERRKSIDIISILVILLSALAFISVLIKEEGRSYIFIATSIILLAGLGLAFYNKKKSGKLTFKTLLVVAGITWFVMPFIPWVSIPVLLLAVLEKPAKLSLEIGFSNDRVVMNSLVRRKLSWTSMNNVLLKDGILTIDYKNNHIFQRETIDEEGDADEAEFNEYCRKRIMESRKE